MKSAAAFFALLLLINCGTKKIDAPIKPTENQVEQKIIKKTVSGVVTDINFGKDGYTAKLKNNKNEVYFITVSRINLNTPEQYKTVAVGEAMNVSGDYWTMEEQHQITVREIIN